MTWENRLIFEVSSTDPDAAIPVWVDLTTRINDMLSTVDIGIGRQNDLEQSEPTNWTLVLNNADDALTYGNTSSPYPWWGPGRKCRLREIVAGTVMPLATGYLQVPSETVSLSGIDQTVTVSIVDRLGRLQVSEPFVSTLAAYIRSSPSRPALVYYTPLHDVPTVTDMISGRTLSNAGGSSSALFGSTVSSQSGALALADDIPSRLLVTDTPGQGRQAGYSLTYTGAAQPALSAGQVLTVVMWVKPVLTADPGLANGSPEACQLILQESGPPGAGTLDIGGNTGVWFGRYSTGGLTGTVVGRNVQFGDATSIAVRYGFNPATLELWIGDDRFVGSLAGSPPTSAALTLVQAPPALPNFRGGASHAQVYIGAPGDFDFAAYQAQRRIALTALERQTTGDRIRTIAQYAGIPNGEFANTIDTGTSVMQAASLAGKTPLEAMREAETTEQGLLYVDGPGNLTFKDRRTLYNI